jgi:hypothetical protein
MRKASEKPHQFAAANAIPTNFFFLSLKNSCTCNALEFQDGKATGWNGSLLLDRNALPVLLYLLVGDR